MNPAYQSWRRSSHTTTACLNCHSDGSAANRFIKLVELSARHIPKEARGKYAPIKVGDTRAVPAKACLGCHKPKDRTVSGRKVVMSHKAHEAIDLECRDCHNRGPHENAQRFAPIDKAEKPVYRNYLAMRDGCWRCHSEGGKFVTAKRETITGPFRLGKAVAATECQTCHAGFDLAKLKGDVDKIWLRHVKQPPWRQGTVHGEVARQVAFKPCQVCHNPAKRCTECHLGITMPHADNWLVARQHGATAKLTKGDACRICHELKEVPSCSSRGHHHEEWVVAKKLDLRETPWKSGKQAHGPVARETNARPCLRCHEQSTWCAKCHNGVTMPHGPEWPKVHFATVGYKPGSGWKPKKTPCDMCHNPTGEDIWFCVRCHHKALVPAAAAGNQIWAAAPMAMSREFFGLDKDLSNGIGPCAKCHTFQFCWRCHESWSAPE